MSALNGKKFHLSNRKKDILVYLLFFGIIAMFCLLAFSLLYKGEFTTQKQSYSIPENTTEITINADMLNLVITESENSKAEIIYDRRISESESDNITFISGPDDLSIDIKRTDINSLLGNFFRSGYLEIRIPKNRMLSVNANLSLSNISVENVSFGDLKLNSFASNIIFTGTSADTLELKGRVCAVNLNNSLVSNLTGDISALMLNINGAKDGFLLRNNTSIGLVSSDPELKLEHQYFIIKNADPVSYLGGASKINIKSYLSITNIK